LVKLAKIRPPNATPRDPVLCRNIGMHQEAAAGRVPGWCTDRGGERLPCGRHTRSACVSARTRNSIAHYYRGSTEGTWRLCPYGALAGLRPDCRGRSNIWPRCSGVARAEHLSPPAWTWPANLIHSLDGRLGLLLSASHDPADQQRHRSEKDNNAKQFPDAHSADSNSPFVAATV
jgi:hypothetical protein